MFEAVIVPKNGDDVCRRALTYEIIPNTCGIKSYLQQN